MFKAIELEMKARQNLTSSRNPLSESRNRDSCVQMAEAGARTAEMQLMKYQGKRPEGSLLNLSLALWQLINVLIVSANRLALSFATALRELP